MKVFPSKFKAILVVFPFMLVTFILQPLQHGRASSPYSQQAFDCTAVSEIPQEECIALVNFYNATHGETWVNNAGWLNNNTPCNWYGLSCTSGTNITRLSLSANNLKGVIPPEMGNLTQLQELLLDNNQLSGNIPSEVVNLVSITGMDFGYNLLTASDATLLSYLNIYDPDWATTQTIPPADVHITNITSTSIEISWTAIPYSGNGGYYEIGWGTDIAGPYTVHGTTSDKAATNYVLSNLLPGGPYFIRVRTYTPAHDLQSVGLWSEYTPSVKQDVINPAPILTGIEPDRWNAGDGGFNLHLDGNNFSSAAQVLWNGIELVTTFVSPSQLSAAVPSQLLQNPGLADVIVQNPVPGGGISKIFSFSVDPYTNSWMAHSPEGGAVFDIEVDQNNPSVLYAATDVAGIYKSVNGGQNWLPINNGIDGPSSFVDIAVSPSNSSIVMASGGETYLSKNGGISWSRVRYGGTSITDNIKFDTQDTNIITLGTSSGLLRTEDAGSTWVDIGKFPGHYIMAVEVDPQNREVIYEVDIDLATDPNPGSRTIWKTTNGGAAWQELNGLPDLTIGNLELDPANSNILYAATSSYEPSSGNGIYKSTDGGKTWTQIVSDNQYYTDIAVDRNNSSRVFVTSELGMYQSGDSGKTWEFIPVARRRDVLSLALDEGDPAILFGAGYQGVYKSLDSGNTWTAINNGLYAHKIVDLAYSSRDAALFAATFQGGVWKSADYGASWAPLNLTVSFLNFMHMDPKDSDHIYVSAAGGIFETRNGGQSWLSRYFYHPFSIVVFNSNSDLFAVSTSGLYGPESVYKSTDNGVSWVKKADLLPACATTCRINSLTPDPVDPDTVYADVTTFDDRDPETGKNSFIYKTSNGGESWVRSDSGTGTATNMALAIDPVDTSILYLGTDQGIFKSTDGAGSWIKIVSGSENWKRITGTIAVDPSNDQIIYVGGFGIHRSVDGGNTWTEFNYGLNSGFVWTVLPIPAPPVADQLAYGQAALQNDKVSRLYSIAGGQVYAYYMVNDQGTYTFKDVPANYWAWSYIERLYAAGITGGCTVTPLNYCPGNTVTRAQMAIFLLRAEHGSSYIPPAATGMFLDVPQGSSTAPWIEQLANEGITGGCGGGNYCPGNPVTRAQMAIFLLRAEHGSKYTPPAATGMFLDIPKMDFTAPFIEQLANEGITGGCGGGKYCPGKAVTRDQMAIFLVRTFKLP